MTTQTAPQPGATTWPALVAAALSTILLVFAILAGPSNAAAPPAQPTQFDLANGLKVVVIPDHRVPIVTHAVFYKIGSLDEKAGEEGLAHYLEHLMFMGTARFPKGAFDRFVMAGGGTQNAVTRHDSTTYYQRMPRDALAQLMELEADRMENLQVDETAALVERNVVMEEFRGKAGQPGFPLYLAMSAALHGDHPYALTPVGHEAGIAAFDAAKAMTFYRRHYAPDRAIVVIGGDVTEAEVRTLAERTYGRVTQKPGTAADVPELRPEGPAAQRVVVPHPQANAVSVSRMYLTPSAGQMRAGDITALSLFVYIVADGQLSRLHTSLVAPGLASGASGSFQLGRAGGTLSFDIAALPGVETGPVEKALDDALTDIVQRGITAEEFADMKQRFLATRVYDADNTASRVDSIGTSLLTGWRLEDILDARNRILSVTLDDVNRVGREMLGRRSVTGVLTPADMPQPVKVSN